MRIQFLKNTSNAIIPDGWDSEDTLVVYRDGYCLPKLHNAHYVEFEKYRSLYTEMSPKNIIMIGTNRIFVPSRRCDLIFEYLQTMTSHIKKISIDTCPFIGEPWRLWFHYSLVYGEWLGYRYSYIVETDWKHYFERDSEKSVVTDKVIKDDVREIHSDLPVLKTCFEFYDPDLFLCDFYNKVKTFAFEKHNTPKIIIQTMLKELNKHLDIDFNFDSFRTNKKYALPNLGIYRFIVEENIRRMKIYNIYGI